MKKRLINILLAYLMAFPLVFSLIFFGYFPMRYDIVIHTDNIVGEGICQTHVCPEGFFSPFFEIGFYFGGKLKKGTITNYHYDVESIRLIISDVSEFEILSIDSYIHGIHLTHFDAGDIIPEGTEFEAPTMIIKSSSGVIHVVVKDPSEGATISFQKDFIPTWFWMLYFVFIFMASLFVAFVIYYVFIRIPPIKLFLMEATCLTVTILCGCFFCGSMPYVVYTHFLLNWLFLFSTSLLINAFTLQPLGTLVTMTFATVWYIANYFVISFRNKPIMPADLKAVGTVAEVMGGYSFFPSWKMAVGIFIVLCYAVILTVLRTVSPKTEEKPLKNRLMKRGLSASIAVGLVIVGVNTGTFRSLNSFAWDAVLLKCFHEDGMILTYLKSAFNSEVRRPDDYSKELVSRYLEEYQDTNIEGDYNIKTLPNNIIMVMNEAFSDLRTVGLNREIDVMPYIDSLGENTVEGSLYVSVYGGGTCNSEFEALTGNSLAFLGIGAYPYTDMSGPLFSLASYFSKQGYSTDAMHPNLPRNWNRDNVYPFFGFDRFHSINDYKSFGNIKYLHGLVSDEFDYEYLESVDDEKAGNRRFIFNVTMQNHSGYERWLDVKKDETVEKNGSDLYLDTQVYLSLVRASDNAVKELVETYKESDEPTMIIFFGDHQPGLPSPAVKELYTDMDSYLDMFKSKFFIWTNYDSPEEHDVEISANYLSLLILRQGGFGYNPYFRMLEEVHGKYPVITSQGVIDSEGKEYLGVAELEDDPLIRKYRNIQYANLHGDMDPAWFEMKE